MISPLYLAIINKHPAVADLLIRSGASLNLLYHEGTEGSRVVTPFHLAVGVEGTEMVNFLIERGLYSLDEVNYAGLPPIWIAYLNKNWEAVDLLVRLGANINHDIARGFTPLAHALFIDKYEAVKKLIAAGADKHIPFVEAPESFRFHPWWKSCEGSHPIALRLLLIYGADPDCILEDGHTPLMYLLTRMFNGKRTWESCFPQIKQLITFGATLDKISGPNDGSDPASPRGYLKQLIRQILYDDPASLTDRYSCRHYLFRHGSDDYGAH
ncbi:ankyrin repeat-containing domain protein [Rhypophila decipiens]|uniref:Ankyrin repeat-containing domain protein n=1 Tax=Rhypophila decipiens TaxID=261697 RepID=A0AAN7B2D9_9PEZI|nr:ankyrin repeat-containing domain protein [Rhypophila decipiens]